MGHKSKKSLLYRLAGRISKILRGYQQRQDEKLLIESERIWFDLFQNGDSFLFQLEKEVKIKLYKDSILSKLIYNGFEKKERDYVMSQLNNGDIFVDVGSNIGLFSLPASIKVGDTGRVICFEPAPTTFNRLLENININKFHNLDIRNLGLSDKQGELQFHLYNDGYDAWNSFAADKNLQSDVAISVRTSTLDHELSDIDKSRIKLIKIDVEGWEKFVLHGGKEFFTNYDPIVLIEFTDTNTFNAGYSIYELYDIMINWGYTWYRLGENNELEKETKQFRYPYVNLIAIKKYIRTLNSI